MGLNVCVFSGRVQGTTELRYSQANKPFLKFTVSVSSFFGGETKYTPFFCTMFGERAEKLQNALVKGAGVVVNATYTYNEYETKDGEKRTSPGFIVNDVDIIKWPEDYVQESKEAVVDEGEPPF